MFLSVLPAGVINDDDSSKRIKTGKKAGKYAELCGTRLFIRAFAASCIAEKLPSYVMPFCIAQCLMCVEKVNSVIKSQNINVKTINLHGYLSLPSLFSPFTLLLSLSLTNTAPRCLLN